MSFQEIQIGKYKLSNVNNSLNILRSESNETNNSGSGYNYKQKKIYIGGYELKLENDNLVLDVDSSNNETETQGTLVVDETIVCDDFILSIKNDKLKLIKKLNTRQVTVKNVNGEWFLFYYHENNQDDVRIYKPNNLDDIYKVEDLIISCTMRELPEESLNNQFIVCNILLIEPNIGDASVVYEGHYALKNTLNNGLLNQLEPNTYVPLFQLNSNGELLNDEIYRLINWLYSFNGSCTEWHKIKVKIDGIETIVGVPCKRPNNSMVGFTSNFSYDTDSYPLVEDDIDIPDLPISANGSTYSMDYTITGGNEQDQFIAKYCLYMWNSVITTKLLDSQYYDMEIDITFEVMSPGILGSAGPTYITTINNKVIPVAGEVTLNTTYWNNEKQQIKYDTRSSAFYTLLHEMGHVLGIGTLWVQNNLINNGEWYTRNDYWNANYTPAYYIGNNALREYKNYLPNSSSLTGIPIENNGGSGTAGGHHEEGDSDHPDRYNDGIIHPGLDHELMTGWSENSTIPEPMSKITIGYLDDIGFTVDYSRAQFYQVPL